MKHVFRLAAAVALMGAASLPALAEECVITNAHVSDAIAPAICLAADTKEKHPDWYRDGGYCAGGTVTTEVTASTSYGDGCR